MPSGTPEGLLDRARDAFVKESQKNYREAYPQPAAAPVPASNRLWYLGSHYPEGFGVREIRDDAWDFTQQMLDESSVVDIPVTLEHDSTVEIGRVWAHLRDGAGRQYHVGYVDDSTPEGKRAQEGIGNGSMKELSLFNETGFFGKSSTDPLLKKVMVPLHVAVVKTGQKPGCKVFSHFTQKIAGMLKRAR